MRYQEVEDKAFLNRNLSKYSMSKSEIYFSKALELAYLFLPHDTPLVVQIQSSYDGYYPNTQQMAQYHQSSKFFYLTLTQIDGGSEAIRPIIRYPVLHKSNQEQFNLIRELKLGILKQEVKIKSPTNFKRNLIFSRYKQEKSPKFKENSALKPNKFSICPST